MLIKYITCFIGSIKLLIYKLIYGGRLHCSFKTIITPSVSFQIARHGLLNLGKDVSIRRGTEINIRNSAKITIGNNTFINSGCIITAHSGIVIGNNVEFGSNVMVYDHDHKFKEGYQAREFDIADVHIGNNVWVGSGSIILRGSIIHDNSVIAAGSVVKGEVPSNSIFLQKRNTEIIKINN